jgi:gliding motility-associated lipoprotein GldH
MHANKSKVNAYFPFKAAMALLILAFFIYGCDRDLVFEKNKTLPDAVWKNKDIIKFNVPINNNNLFCNFYLNVRVTSQYKFANLFLFMKTLYPNGQISIDTVECFLADINGRWLGSRSGKIINNHIPLRKNMNFPLQGVYSFEFEQAMRDSALEYVEDFGIRIEKAEK